MNTAAVADATLRGWKGKLVDKVAQPVSERTSLSADQFRALVGVALLALSVWAVIKRIQKVVRAAQS